MNHQTAKDIFLKLFEGALNIFLLVGELGQRLRYHFAFDFGDPLVAFEFFRDFQGLLEFGRGQVIDPSDDLFIEHSQRHMPLGFAELAAQIFLDLQQRLDCIMTGKQRF